MQLTIINKSGLEIIDCTSLGMNMEAKIEGRDSPVSGGFQNLLEQRWMLCLISPLSNYRPLLSRPPPSHCFTSLLLSQRTVYINLLKFTRMRFYLRTRSAPSRLFLFFHPPLPPFLPFRSLISLFYGSLTASWRKMGKRSGCDGEEGGWVSGGE